MEARHSTEEALLQFKQGMGVFTEKMPDFASRFNAFTEECFKGGALSEKDKQLIALGISLYNQHEYCIIYHAKGCLDQGCSEEEILEAAGVAAAFGGGASISQSVTLLQKCVQELGGGTIQ